MRNRGVRGLRGYFICVYAEFVSSRQLSSFNACFFQQGSEAEVIPVLQKLRVSGKGQY